MSDKRDVHKAKKHKQGQKREQAHGRPSAVLTPGLAGNAADVADAGVTSREAKVGNVPVIPATGKRAKSGNRK